MKKINIVDNGVNVDFVDEDLIKPIAKIYDSIQIFEDDIKILSIALIFNKEFPEFTKKYEDDLYSIIEFNFPKIMDGKQNNEINRFINNARQIFSNQNKLKIKEAGIEHISLILLFNKTFDSINIKGVNFKKNKETGTNMLFVPKVPKYNLDQVILNEDLEKEIKKSLIILEKRELIYNKWGFAEIEPSPKAILNFYGPSGTGKTMTAHAIANFLNIKIMALNYADIESKFVGDAPKNLVRAFEIAGNENALLFFDEADSFLGKRITNISSSSDQAVNSLRSQLLILLEDFEGVVIFATNLVSNYDKAFESRIFKHLKFDLPDKEGRKKIISKSIPNRVPFDGNVSLTDDQLDTLSDISDGLSGRHIKNAILNALTNAALSGNEFLTYDDFFQSFEKLKIETEDLNKNSITIDSNKKKKLEMKISDRLKQKTKNRYKSR